MLNLEGEFGFALRLPPNDESQQETHSEDQAEGCDVPRCSASLHGQYAERQDEGPWRDRGCLFLNILLSFHRTWFVITQPQQKKMQSGSLAPTHERGTDVDGETRQCGRLGVVGEN